MKKISAFLQLLFFGSVAFASEPQDISDAKKETVKGHKEVAQNQVVVCSNIVNREPVDLRESFEGAHAKVWAQINLHLPNTSWIEFVWSVDGLHYKTIKLPVTKGSDRWRTYSWIGAKKGSWTVEVKDDKGDVISKGSFRVGLNKDDYSESNKNLVTESSNEKDSSQTKSVGGILKSLEQKPESKDSDNIAEKTDDNAKNEVSEKEADAENKDTKDTGSDNEEGNDSE